jgi:hypothetical protein
MENNNQNFLEELKEYFRTTSKEQILEDWNKSQEYDKVGPTVDEFIDNTKTECEHQWVMTADPFDQTCYCKKCNKFG